MTDSQSPVHPTVADSGWYVRIKYSVRVVDGPILKGDATPAMLDFVTGYGQVIPGLERRLVGHTAGETLSFVVPPEEAFGLSYENSYLRKNGRTLIFPKALSRFREWKSLWSARIQARRTRCTHQRSP